jgi:hypothetical protein
MRDISPENLAALQARKIDPDTGGPVTRTYYGSGNLTSTSAIPLVANLAAQTVTIRMSQIHERVEALLRQYDADQAPIEIHRGLFSPETRQLVAPAFCRFVGRVDKADIKTPPQNKDGAAILTCRSHTQELTRANSDIRSHESQKLRLDGDAFFQHSSVVSSWEQVWGRNFGTVATARSDPA